MNVYAFKHPPVTSSSSFSPGPLFSPESSSLINFVTSNGSTEVATRLARAPSTRLFKTLAHTRRYSAARRWHCCCWLADNRSREVDFCNQVSKCFWACPATAWLKMTSIAFSILRSLPHEAAAGAQSRLPSERCCNQNVQVLLVRVASRRGTYQITLASAFACSFLVPPFLSSPAAPGQSAPSNSALTS